MRNAALTAARDAEDALSAGETDPVERAVRLTLAATAAEETDARELFFSRLDEVLEAMSPAQIAAVLDDARATRVRAETHHVRAEYEYAREFELAREIVAARDVAPVADFRSADWYDKAQAFEIAALARYGLSSAMFVGGGPYPTTALAYAFSAPRARVATLERYADAAALAREVAGVYGRPDLEVIEDDALEYAGYGDFDCVVIGLVVGADAEEKRAVVARALELTPPSTLLAFRSAVGLGRVVYPSVDLEMLRPHGRVIALPEPPHKSFTMILLERGGRAASPAW